MIFSVEETIEAPVGVVWRHLTDPAIMTAWMSGIEDMRLRDGGVLALGSELVFTARGAKRSTKVVEFIPEQSISLQSVQGPVTATYRYTVAPEGTATRVTLQADCAARGLAKLFMPLLRPLIRRTDGGQLKALNTAITVRIR